MLRAQPEVLRIQPEVLRAQLEVLRAQRKVLRAQPEVLRCTAKGAESIAGVAVPKTLIYGQIWNKKVKKYGIYLT